MLTWIVWVVIWPLCAVLGYQLGRASMVMRPQRSPRYVSPRALAGQGAAAAFRRQRRAGREVRS